MPWIIVEDKYGIRGIDTRGIIEFVIVGKEEKQIDLYVKDAPVRSFYYTDAQSARANFVCLLESLNALEKNSK